MEHDPTPHLHAAETHRKTAQAYHDKASESVALSQAHPYGSDLYRKHEEDYLHNARLSHHHSEQALFAKRRAEGVDPDTGRPRPWS